jgi:antitoxin CptB
LSGRVEAVELADRAAGAPGRLRWRCRRGMKELDVLFERALHELLPQASPTERRTFEELLTLPDPLLAAWLIAGEAPSQPHLQEWVVRIRALCRLGDGSALFCTQSHSGRSC